MACHATSFRPAHHLPSLLHFRLQDAKKIYSFKAFYMALVLYECALGWKTRLSECRDIEAAIRRAAKSDTATETEILMQYILPGIGYPITFLQGSNWKSPVNGAYV